MLIKLMCFICKRDKKGICRIIVKTLTLMYGAVYCEREPFRHTEKGPPLPRMMDHIVQDTAIIGLMPHNYGIIKRDADELFPGRNFS